MTSPPEAAIAVTDIDLAGTDFPQAANEQSATPPEVLPKKAGPSHRRTQKSLGYSPVNSIYALATSGVTHPGSGYSELQPYDQAAETIHMREIPRMTATVHCPTSFWY